MSVDAAAWAQLTEQSSGPSIEILLERIPDPVLVVDAETGAILKANAAAETQLGSETAVLTNHDQSVLHPDGSKEQFLKAFDPRLSDPTQSGFQPVLVSTLAGECEQMAVYSQQITYKNRECLLAVFQSTGERDDTQWQQQHSQAQLQALLDAMPIPVVGIDSIGNVEVWNTAATETFGWSREDIIGQPIFPLVVDDRSRIDDLYVQLTGDGIIDGVQLTVQSKSGAHIETELHTRPLHVDGQFVGAIGTARDLRERIHLQQRLETLHRVLRHNLRTQLNIIRGFTNLLAEEAPIEDPEHAQYVDYVTESADQLVALSEDVRQLRDSIADSPTDTVPLSDLVATLRTLSIPGSQPPEITIDEELTDVQVPSQSEPVLKGLSTYLLEQGVGDQSSFDIQVTTTQQSIAVNLATDRPDLCADLATILTADTQAALTHECKLTLSRVQILMTTIGAELSVDGGELTVRLPRSDL